ncbi:hypothetical protein CPB83DRAFT_896432 [Crepidotus variabilis]|uniref:Uncharacterized protein n=1 Tax=Crepidotus variabilis TaxID=179855 RepID=A0A9P6JMB7_9AGAR|nr:hypothetical protein CPB83DRAFT_896432 [Crepidotus variabilis]
MIQPETIACLATFAGEKATQLVLQHLNGVENVLNLRADARESYDDWQWGIKAQDDGEQVKYVYPNVPSSSKPDMINLDDGQEIVFGGGDDGVKLGKGPLPLLCNILLTLARVLQMSGAADIILQMQEDADDSNLGHSYIASDLRFDILRSKLLLHPTRGSGVSN